MTTRIVLAALALSGCTYVTIVEAPDSGADEGRDSGVIDVEMDSGLPEEVPDSGAPDAGLPEVDSGTDAGPPEEPDAGPQDAGPPPEHRGEYTNYEDCDPVPRVPMGTHGYLPGYASDHCTLDWTVGGREVNYRWAYPPSWRPFARFRPSAPNLAYGVCTHPQNCEQGYFCDGATYETHEDGSLTVLTTGVCRPYCWPSEGSCYDISWEVFDRPTSGRVSSETDPSSPGTCVVIVDAERGVNPIGVGVCRPR